MGFGSRIYDMLDELDKAEQGREEYSKYPIIEKHFKKIREDTRDECIAVVEEWVDEEYCAIALEEIKKL